jgi:hypothetical protein
MRIDLSAHGLQFFEPGLAVEIFQRDQDSFQCGATFLVASGQGGERKFLFRRFLQLFVDLIDEE